MIKTITINTTEELDTKCIELAKKHASELIAIRRKELHTDVGRPAHKSTFYRMALQYYCDAVEDSGKLL